MNYRIRPLEWIKKNEEVIAAVNLRQLHESNTPISKFIVEQWASGPYAYEYDGGGGHCESIEGGKSICEKIWEDKLKKCLIEVKEN